MPARWVQWAGLALALLVLAGAAACNQLKPAAEQPVATTAAPAASSGAHPLMDEAAANAGIVGNQMHTRHLQAAKCGDCHPANQPLTAVEAVMMCSVCHDQTVKAESWEYHCLGCHHFKYTDEQSKDPQMVRKLCVECHNESQDAQKIYAFCSREAAHNITCSNCHRPHEVATVVSGETCAECHEGLTVVQHPAGSHTSCDMCHTPHQPQRTGTEICSSCHFAMPDLVVHRIPEHPKDCLACHSAHNSTSELTYSPDPYNCKTCHVDVEKVVCGGTMSNCLWCHGGTEVKPGSAACGDCHLQTQRGPHKGDCLICHVPHSFDVPDNQCAGCHTALPGLHRGSGHQDCLSCHALHSFRVLQPDKCTTCHAGLPAACTPGADCSSCHSFLGS